MVKRILSALGWLPVVVFALGVGPWIAHALDPKPGQISYPVSGTIDTVGVTVTGSATLVLAASSFPRWHLFLMNRSSDNLHCSFKTATPTVGGATTFALMGLGSNRPFPHSVPTNALYCISSGTSSGITAEFAP